MCASVQTSASLVDILYFIILLCFWDMFSFFLCNAVYCRKRNDVTLRQREETTVSFFVISYKMLCSLSLRRKPNQINKQRKEEFKKTERNRWLLFLDISNFRSEYSRDPIISRKRKCAIHVMPDYACYELLLCPTIHENV